MRFILLWVFLFLFGNKKKREAFRRWKANRAKEKKKDKDFLNSLAIYVKKNEARKFLAQLRQEQKEKRLRLRKMRRNKGLGSA